MGDKKDMKYKKTERIYTPVESMAHFATKIAKFGDKTAYRYFDRQRNLHSLTYKNLSAKFLQQAAGYSAAGLAGKRIAVIGETSVEWVCSYVAAIAAGGVAVPMDRELAVSEIEGFLEFAEVDAIVYSQSLTKSLKILQRVILPLRP